MIDDAWLARARSFLAKKQSTWANHDVLNAQMVDLLPEALAEIEHLGGEIKELEVLRSDLTEDLRKQEQISDQLREALIEAWADIILFHPNYIKWRYQNDIDKLPEIWINPDMDKEDSFPRWEACKKEARRQLELEGLI